MRSTAVVVEDGHLLVIGRRKNGREYSVLPGGGVEEGETPREACLRELWEETGLVGVIVAELHRECTAQDSAIYFHVRTSRGNPTLTGGPELATSGEENVYRPGWAPVAELETIHLVPEHALAAVRALL
ncbi:NUDIX domain-containing protein [Brachybacterium sp.]|uniref:NUDIX domain-containing protein n=1 Tax=Brachybacterium sp. TaxID=1891286 RepID=UPI002ED5CD21